MSKLNRKFFFDHVRLHLFGGSLKQSQVDGMTAILDKWESDHATGDDRWLAYMFATTYHETDRKIQAIEEYGKGQGKPYGIPDPVTGKKYYGRGLVQLTWKDNYRKMGNVFNVDLVKYPEKVLDLDLSVKIMFYGMAKGSFTGKKLSDYFNSTKSDWVNARKIINGLDKATLIAGYGKDFYAAISYTT
jgi:putative chitinase